MVCQKAPTAGVVLGGTLKNSTTKLEELGGDMSDSNVIVPELLTTREAATLCGIGERSLWRWSRSGQAPPPVKIGGTAVRYRRAELLDWIEAGCPPRPGANSPI